MHLAKKLQIENLYLTFNLNTKCYFAIFFLLTYTNENEDRPVVEVCKGGPEVHQATVSSQGRHHGGEHPGKPDPGLRARYVLDKIL